MAILIQVEEPILPQGVTHTATTWVVSTDPTFQDVGQVIDESVEDTVDLLEHTVNYTIPDEVFIFVRAKYHFSDATETIWTNVISLSSSDVKKENVINILVTPSIRTQNIFFDGREDIVIESDPLRTLYGSAVCESTTWKLINSSGDVLWERIRDSDNLDTITIPKRVFKYEDIDNILTVTCQKHSELGDSNVGKLDLNITYQSTFITIPGTDVLIADDFNNIDVVVNDTNFTHFTYILFNEAEELILRELINGTFIDIERAVIMGRLTPGETCKLTIEYDQTNVGVIKQDFFLPVIARDISYVFSNITKVTDMTKAYNSIVPGVISKSTSFETKSNIVPVIDPTSNAINFYAKNEDLSIGQYAFNLNNVHQDTMLELAVNHTYTIRPLGNGLFGVSIMTAFGRFSFQVYRFLKNSSDVYNIISKRLFQFDAEPETDTYKPFCVFDERSVIFGNYITETDSHELIKVNIYTGTTEHLPLPAMAFDGDINVENYGENNFIVYGYSAGIGKAIVISRDLIPSITFDAFSDSENRIYTLPTETGIVYSFTDVDGLNVWNEIISNTINRRGEFLNPIDKLNLVTSDGKFAVTQ